MTEAAAFMTYLLRCQKVVPHYNVMALAKSFAGIGCTLSGLRAGQKNIRVNAISADHQNAGCARRGRAGRDDEGARRPRTAAPQCGSARSGRRGPFPRQRSSSARHRRDIYVDCGYNIMGYSRTSIPPDSQIHRKNLRSHCRLTGRLSIIFRARCCLADLLTGRPLTRSVLQREVILRASPPLRQSRSRPWRACGGS